ncbi:MAG: beta-ketoacyl synthase N-terminal-like domain-containing protein [Nitrospirota bacterium]
MIVVTGIGIVSAYGIGKEAFFSGAIKSSGIAELEDIRQKNYGITRSGIIKDFTPKKIIPVMKARKMSRFSQIALISAIEAWKDASIEGCYDSSDIGVIIGTGLGSVSSTDSFYAGLLENGPEETNPILFPETVQNIASAHISIELGLHGPNTTFSEAGIAGESAIFYASELLKYGMTNSVLVTGADELTYPLFDGMKALRVFSKNNTSMPFDIRRDGLIPGEGACTLVLERISDATKRGAHIYGEIHSFGFSAEPVERLHYSSSMCMADAIKNALNNKKPDLIIASANSTKDLDYKEANAISKTIDGNVPVTTLTSMTGFFMSSGIMRVGAAMLFMEKGVVPPIWGLEDPEVKGLGYVLETKEMKIKNVLVNGFSHGGGNICIFVRSQTCPR